MTTDFPRLNHNPGWGLAIVGAPMMPAGDIFADEMVRAELPDDAVAALPVMARNST